MAGKYSLQDQVDAANNRDTDAYVSFYRDDATVYDPTYPEPLKGREAIRKDFEDFIGAFPDLKFTISTVLEGGDRLAYDGTGKATHQGPLAGPTGEIPPTGRPANLSFAGFLQLDDEGKIVEERRYFDLAGMMVQLGLMEG